MRYVHLIAEKRILCGGMRINAADQKIGPKSEVGRIKGQDRGSAIEASQGVDDGFLALR